MSSSINTNIASLNAQRNLSNSQSALNTALQRLSSGLRINNAKDDAAGLSISDRMTSQINGMNQAARNANDGISLAQTAEGSLNQVSTNLQRIRTLALQSANSTNSASDRSALNSEVQQLLSEIQRVSETTQFNGLNLLDGSFSSAQFQVGANASQTVAVSVEGASTSQLGAYQVTSSVVTKDAFTGSGFTINGATIGVSAATSAAGVTAASATAKATAINAKTTETGVTAVATNELTSANTYAPVQASALSSGVLKINGIEIGSVAAGSSIIAQGRNAATAINAVSNKTGVTATADATSGKLTLSTTDGRNIELTTATGSPAEADDILNATGLDVSSGANATTHDRVVLTAGAGGYDADGSTAASVMAGDTFILDNITYEFVTTGSSVTTTGNVKVEVADGANTAAVGAAIELAIDGQHTLGKTSMQASAAAGVVTIDSDKFGNQDSAADLTALDDATG